MKAVKRAVGMVYEPSFNPFDEAFMDEEPPKKPSIFSRASTRIKGLFKSKKEIAEDTAKDTAANELKQKLLAQKSWFDSLSSGWYHAHPAIKITTFMAVLFFTVCIGLIVGYPIVLGAVTAGLLLGMHQLLVLHERNRIKQADFAVTETVKKNKELAASKKVLDDAAVLSSTVALKMESQAKSINESVQSLNNDATEVRAQRVELGDAISQLTEVTGNVVSEDRKMKNVVLHTAEHLRVLDETFHEMDCDLQETQQSLDFLKKIEASSNGALGDSMEQIATVRDSSQRFFDQAQKVRNNAAKAKSIPLAKTFVAHVNKLVNPVERMKIRDEMEKDGFFDQAYKEYIKLFGEGDWHDLNRGLANQKSLTEKGNTAGLAASTEKVTHLEAKISNRMRKLAAQCERDAVVIIKSKEQIALDKAYQEFEILQNKGSWERLEKKHKEIKKLQTLVDQQFAARQGSSKAQACSP